MPERRVPRRLEPRRARHRQARAEDQPEQRRACEREIDIALARGQQLRHGIGWGLRLPRPHRLTDLATALSAAGTPALIGRVALAQALAGLPLVPLR